MANLVGRLWALRISICVMAIGVVVQVVPNTFAVLIVGRLLTGLGFGCVYIATSLYGIYGLPRLYQASNVKQLPSVRPRLFVGALSEPSLSSDTNSAH